MRNDDRQTTKDRRFPSVVPAFLTALAVIAPPALAQNTQAGAGPQLSVELNTVRDIEGGCRMMFMARNTLAADIETLVLEAVLFTREGGVERLTLLDFQDLPRGRPRVRQFDFQGPTCKSLGQILINGVHACTGVGTESTACTEGLRLDSRTDHEVLG